MKRLNVGAASIKKQGEAQDPERNKVQELELRCVGSARTDPLPLADNLKPIVIVVLMGCCKLNAHEKHMLANADCSG